MAKLQAASAAPWNRQTDGQTDGSWYRLMPPFTAGHNNSPRVELPSAGEGHIVSPPRGDNLFELISNVCYVYTHPAHGGINVSRGQTAPGGFSSSQYAQLSVSS